MVISGHLLFVGHVANIKCLKLFQPVLPSHPKGAIFLVSMIFNFVGDLYLVPIFVLIVPSSKPFGFRPWISYFDNFRCSTRMLSFPRIILSFDLGKSTYTKVTEASSSIAYACPATKPKTQTSSFLMLDRRPFSVSVFDVANKASCWIR